VLVKAAHMKLSHSRMPFVRTYLCLLLRRPIATPLMTGDYLNPTVLTVLKAVLTHRIRNVIIHSITSPKSKATVFSNL
jgi:hypothetical protein